LYVVPDIFFDQEAILENGNQVTHKNQKLGSLVGSRGGGGGGVILVLLERSTNGTGERPQFAPRVFWRWCAGSAGYSRTGSLAKPPPGPTRFGELVSNYWNILLILTSLDASVVTTVSIWIYWGYTLLLPRIYWDIPFYYLGSFHTNYTSVACVVGPSVN
jgi:hypothetical protein